MSGERAITLSRLFLLQHTRMRCPILDPVWPFLPGDLLPLLPDFVRPGLHFPHMLDTRTGFVHLFHERDRHLSNLCSFLKQFAEFILRQILTIVCGSQMSLRFVQAS